MNDKIFKIKTKSKCKIGVFFQHKEWFDRIFDMYIQFNESIIKSVTRSYTHNEACIIFKNNVIIHFTVLNENKTRGRKFDIIVVEDCIKICDIDALIKPMLSNTAIAPTIMLCNIQGEMIDFQ